MPSTTVPQKILLYPCNGNAIEALDCLDERWECVGFIDDSTEKQGTVVAQLPVHDRSALQRWADAKILAVPGGPGSFRQRQSIIDSLAVATERFARIVHPAAVIGKQASVGYNTLVMAGVVLTSNATIGNHCCILPNTVIHHDSCVADWSLVGANVTIAGNVSIGRNSYIGSASSVMNDVTIGPEALVGFAANVIRHVSANACVAGNPARILSNG